MGDSCGSRPAEDLENAKAVDRLNLCGGCVCFFTWSIRSIRGAFARCGAKSPASLPATGQGYEHGRACPRSRSDGSLGWGYSQETRGSSHDAFGAEDVQP